jgi:hypothetical protein
VSSESPVGDRVTTICEFTIGARMSHLREPTGGGRDSR